MTNCLNKKLVVVWSWEPSLIGKNLFNWKPENFGCWASQFLLGDMSLWKKNQLCSRWVYILFVGWLQVVICVVAFDWASSMVVGWTVTWEQFVGETLFSKV